MCNDLLPVSQVAFLFLYLSAITTLNSFLSSHVHYISHKFISIPILLNVDYAPLGHETNA